ncbi:PqqD family peptide modification chaperone [Dapis sp. BLCC M126]|uniref:PqqD family peptide modification chaperone n=1 Tax=Dapis sp. BLCC M126 TaxID=3400189 RepID=UPI003CF7A352
MITKNCVVVAAKDNTSEELDKETVVLNLKSGVYYGLNKVGTTIWSHIQEPKAVNEIRDAILTKYKIDSEQCESDILTLLQELETEGLIEVRDGATA